MRAVLLAVLSLVACVTVSCYTPPSLQLPDTSQAEFTPARRLLDDESQQAAQIEFWLALNNGNITKMREAKDNGADPSAKTEPSEYRPIHLAAAIGNLEAMMLLLSYGVDVDAQTINGTTALHYAANHGDVLIMGILLTGGADPDLGDRRGFVALHYVAYSNQKQFLKAKNLYTDYDAVVKEAPTEISVTSAAVSKSTIPGMGEFVKCAQLLISFKADVTKATVVKETPLHYTPAFDSYEIAQLLIKAGADVNARDDQDETALHEAAAYGAIGVAQVLILNGADPSLKETNGLTTEEFICRCRTYKNDPKLTQCAPGKCVGEQDSLVLRRIFAVSNGQP